MQGQVGELVSRDVKTYDDQGPLDPLAPVEKVAADPQLGQRNREVAGQVGQPIRFLDQFGDVA
jgi:hypothetical protein